MSSSCLSTLKTSGFRLHSQDEYALETRIAANEQGIRDLWADQNRQDFEIAALDTRVDGYA